MQAVVATATFDMNQSTNEVITQDPPSVTGFQTGAPASRKVYRFAGLENLAPGCVEDIPLGRASTVPVVSRALDIVASLVGLIVFAPVMLVIAIFLRSETPGPILFRQKRIGHNGEPFTLVKFRTFYTDAKERFPEMYAYKYESKDIHSLVFKEDVDPRITPRGAWLRKTSLDELPNLWNVLKGDMALVGPRPDILEMLPYYRGEMLTRFSARPGLTGLAHVSGRSNLTFVDTVAYDLDYIERRSLWLDLTIIWRTFVSVIKRDGAF